MYDGKRKDRMRIPDQVNLDPELGSEIRASAAREDRPIGLHIVVLLKEAVVARRQTMFHERRGQGAHGYAQVRTSAQSAAPMRTETHVEKRKDGTRGD